MEVEFSTAQREARHHFRSFVQEEITPHAGEWDRSAQIPSKIIAELKSRGYLGAPVTKELGGKGWDAITYGVLTEEIGRACSSVRSLLTVHDMVALAIMSWGNDFLRNEFARPMASGRLIGGLALSEPNAGSDSSSIETKAECTGKNYVLNGKKCWITFGQIADVFLVAARCDRGISTFVVPAASEGLSREKVEVVGTRASLIADLSFSDCVVPAEFLLGKAGFGGIQAIATALDHGRYSVAWGCVGITQACLDSCLEYTHKRKQFGVPICQHQLVQRKLTEMITNARAARLLCCRAGYLRDKRDPQAMSETLVAKYFASRAATQAANSAVQLHGANGLSEKYPVARFLRDAKVMEIIEGSTEIQQIAIATCSHEEF